MKTTNEELKDRDIGMCFIILFAVIVVVLSLCGCATKQAVQNLQSKSMVGDGFVAVSKIIVSDPEAGDYTPMLKTIVVSGKLMTILKDANMLNYTRNTSSSVWNAKSVSTQETLTISVPQGKNLSDVLKEFTKLTETTQEYKSAEQETKKE